MRRIKILTLSVLVLILSACEIPFVPPEEPRLMTEQEGSFVLSQVNESWRFTLSLNEPAERLVVVVSGLNLSTDQRECRENPDVNDSIICEPGESGVIEYSVIVESDREPFGTGSLFFLSNRVQPVLFTH